MRDFLTHNHEKELKSILVARSRDGATIDEIRTDFLQLCGEVPKLFDKEFSVIRSCLQSVEDVSCVVENNCYLWYCRSSPTKHLVEMVSKQKPPRNAGATFGEGRLRRKPYYRSTNSCFFEDNNNYKRMRRQYISEPSLMQSKTSSNSSLDSGGNTFRNPRHWNRNHKAPRPAYFYEYQLVGDDFFLALATAELSCLAERNRNNVLHSGLCVSGQTIREASIQVSSLVNPIANNVILNIGSVDLLHGTEYVDMKNDFINLYLAFEMRGITPIVTTLAPLANQKHNAEIERKWKRFNDFLVAFCPRVVDIRSVFMAKGTGHTIHDCFQRAAVYVSGSCQPHALWSRVGRQRVVVHLKREVYENDTYEEIER